MTGEVRAASAGPTKRFFIDMITKDISLIPAINDLVDNSIDGAKRLGAIDDFSDYEVHVVANEGRFSIRDNCGGIPLDIAEKYAFRFGRPKNFPDVSHSVGQFGVGMKRALFKLGSHFRVESDSGQDSFTLAVDVDKWARKADDWTFQLTDVERYSADRQPGGTTIVVDKLHESVAEDLGTQSFRNRLRAEIASSHRQMLEKGLTITLNGGAVQVDIARLLESSEISAAHRDRVFGDGEPVTVQIFAGLAESSPQAAGWYIFCNGRQVLQADQTDLTGWGEGSGKTIPKYHNQYARFRGYVFLESDDSSQLPWNTTKTGVDRDHAIYRSIRSDMVAVMRPVIDFLNKLDNEIDEYGDERRGPYYSAVQAATPRPLSRLVPAAVFTGEPEVRQDKPSGPKMGRIQYSRPVSQIQLAQKELGVSTYKEVGELTFDYYMELEGLE